MIFINKIIQDPTEIRTRISRFKVLGANRYTMESRIGYLTVSLLDWIGLDT